MSGGRNNKIDLRFTDFREVILEVGNAIEECPLTDKALALLISDATSLNKTQALEVIKALPYLKHKYLKKGK